jgi:hypothetical protein
MTAHGQVLTSSTVRRFPLHPHVIAAAASAAASPCAPFLRERLSEIPLCLVWYNKKPEQRSPPHVPGFLSLLETWARFRPHGMRRNRRFLLAESYFRSCTCPKMVISTLILSPSCRGCGIVTETDTTPASRYSPDCSSVLTHITLPWFLAIIK